jgi:GDP-L-fucose synthase
MDLKNKKILVTGGAGFLGSHVTKKLIERGVPEENIFVPRSEEYDLRSRKDCEGVVAGKDLVIHLAAKVGGIGFNQEKPGELFYDNIVMGANMIDAAYRAGVKKFIAIGTICSYPKFTPVPFKEENFWNGYPEETNASYGLAKKALLIQAQAYRAQYGFNVVYLLPVNLYGPGDNFDPRSSHVLPALIKKVRDAQKTNANFIEAWGTGRPTREFLYVEDAAEGIVLAAERYDKTDPVNLGSGMEISIRELVELICRLMNFKGEIRWDTSKPDGQPRRRLDVSRAEREFGFRAKVGLEDGLRNTIDWWRKNAEIIDKNG